MVGALFRAIGALAEPTMRRVVALSLGLAVLTFVLLWFAIAALLYRTSFFDWRVLNWLVDLLGGLAVLGLTWLLFPAVVTLIMGFYLERVAAAFRGRPILTAEQIEDVVAFLKTLRE